MNLVRYVRFVAALTAAALLALLLQGCDTAAPEEAAGTFGVGAQAPDFTLPASTGEVTLSDYQGKQPVLLFFHMAVG